MFLFVTLCTTLLSNLFILLQFRLQSIIMSNDDFILNIDDSTTTTTMMKQKQKKTFKQIQLESKAIKRNAFELKKMSKLAIQQPPQEAMSSTNTAPLGTRVYRLPSTNPPIQSKPNNNFQTSDAGSKRPETISTPYIKSNRNINDMKPESEAADNTHSHSPSTASSLKTLDIDTSKPFISSLFTSNPTIFKDLDNNSDHDYTHQKAPKIFTKNDTFADIGILPELCAHLEKQSIIQPTNIQQQAIPHLLSPSRDYIIKAQTGSGKTCK